APAQHLALATFRAIESRRDLIHATGTGISALVDPRGSVVVAMPPNRATADPRPPGRLAVDVALMDVFSAGPHTVRWVPRASLVALGLLASGRPRRDRRGRR